MSGAVDSNRDFCVNRAVVLSAPQWLIANKYYHMFASSPVDAARGWRSERSPMKAQDPFLHMINIKIPMTLTFLALSHNTADD